MSVHATGFAHNYAIRLGWNDGHSSGLYTWETLRRIAAKPAG